MTSPVRWPPSNLPSPACGWTLFAPQFPGNCRLRRQTQTSRGRVADVDGFIAAICPGFPWTRAWEGLVAPLEATVPAFAELAPRDTCLEVVKRQLPLGREQTPEDIGKRVVFLASDEARNSTGQEIQVDAGITLKGGG